MNNNDRETERFAKYLFRRPKTKQAIYIYWQRWQILEFSDHLPEANDDCVFNDNNVTNK